jgi:hypothetical protein
MDVSAGYIDLRMGRWLEDFVSDLVFVEVAARHGPLVLHAALVRAL